MLHIEDMVSNESWEALQDSLAQITQLAIITVSYDGTPVTKHSSCHDFCSKIRQNPSFAKYCEQCDARGGFEAMRSNKPYIYKCHFDIVDIAIPVIINNKYIGAIMAGQVRLIDDENINLEKILHPSCEEELLDEKENLELEYSKLPFLSIGRLRVVSDMLFYLCNFVGASLARHQQEIYQTAHPEKVFPEPDIFIETIDGKQNSRKIIDEYTGGQYKYFSDPVKQAVEYIFSNSPAFPDLKETANHCHVSPGYLSRLFSKEVSEGYSTFVTRLKIEKARDLLKNTNISINNLSISLGYEDTGYFIKVFKRYNSVTPAVYRKLIRKTT